MIRTAFLLVALLGLACAAPSRTSTSSATASRQVAKQDGEGAGLVCRTERPTGSNYPRRVCYRQEDLDAAAAAAQDSHRRAVSNTGQTRKE